MLFKIKSICKGGGYRYCRTEPAHPKRNKMGLYPLHRVLAENKIGRLLKDDEVVHHIDHNKKNDNPENLDVLKRDEHARKHRLEYSAKPIKAMCRRCGKYMFIKQSNYNSRMKRSLRGAVFCGLMCAGGANKGKTKLPKHGTISGYYHYKCRCGKCRFAVNVYKRKRKLRLSSTG